MNDRPPFDVARLDELDEFPVGEHGLRWRPIRRRFGIRAFGVNAYSADRAGDEVVEDHTEGQNLHEELYVVVTGRATFRVAEEELDAPAGTLVYIRDPGARRAATAAEDGTTVLAVGGPAGSVYSPSAWEHWFAAYPRADAGELEAAIVELESGFAEHPGHPALHYHLACLKARAGKTDEALDHLEVAAASGQQFAEWAAKDPDLEAIRSDPRFPRASGLPGA